jgi:hypothetical protein
MVKATLLLSMILFFLLFSAPEVSIAQPLGGNGFVNPLGGVPAGVVNGGFHFHINPLEDHPAYESLDKDSHQYYALHGYEHYRGKDLQQVDRFPDIQYPKHQPYIPFSSESFFGVEIDNPLKW